MKTKEQVQDLLEEVVAEKEEYLRNSGFGKECVDEDDIDTNYFDGKIAAYNEVLR